MIYAVEPNRIFERTQPTGKVRRVWRTDEAEQENEYTAKPDAPMVLRKREEADGEEHILDESA